MKTIGIQIKSTTAILVVLEKDTNGVIAQTNESVKFDIQEPNDSKQVKQFRDQVNAAFDSINPDRIGIVVRNAKAKGDRTPSPISFKLEGIIQLYDKVDIEFIWPQTLTAHFKKKPQTQSAKHKYQEDAFNVSYYLNIK